MDNEICAICFDAGGHYQYLRSDWGFGTKPVCKKCAKVLNDDSWLTLSVF